MLIITGLHFKEDACDSDDDMLDDCHYESSFEEEPSKAALNLNTNVSFDASLYSSRECAQAPLYPGSSVTLLQAVASQFLWFSSNPGISKESLSHPVTVQKYFLPVNNILPNNYEEAYAIIKPFLVDTISFHACPHDCVLEIQTATSIAASINALSAGPSSIRVRTFQVSTFCIYHWGFGYKMEWP